MIVDNLKDIMTMETLILNAVILTHFFTVMFSVLTDKVYPKIILEISISILTVGACFLYPDIAVIMIISWFWFLTGVIVGISYLAFLNWLHDDDNVNDDDNDNNKDKR